MYAARRGGGMGMGEAVTAILTGGVGFVIADGLDRFMATYNPSSTAARPTDIFTSDGAGTLANTLNIASRPNWKRAAVAGAAVAVPAAGAYFVKNRMAKAAFEGLLVGAGINGLKLLVNNLVMPMLVGKDTSTPALQKSFFARLYPAETAAKISMAQKPNSAGVLSGQDVGPYALSDSSKYPDASEALRRQAGVQASSDYMDAAEALRKQAGVSYQPGPPDGPGPGPTSSAEEACGCADPGSKYNSFLGDKQEEGSLFS